MACHKTVVFSIESWNRHTCTSFAQIMHLANKRRQLCVKPDIAECFQASPHLSCFSSFGVLNYLMLFPNQKQWIRNLPLFPFPFSELDTEHFACRIGHSFAFLRFLRFLCVSFLEMCPSTCVHWQKAGKKKAPQSWYDCIYDCIKVIFSMFFPPPKKVHRCASVTHRTKEAYRHFFAVLCQCKCAHLLCTGENKIKELFVLPVLELDIFLSKAELKRKERKQNLRIKKWEWENLFTPFMKRGFLHLLLDNHFFYHSLWSFKT